MKFYPNQNFQKRQYHNGTLWYAGKITENELSNIHLRMCRKEIPTVKKNFALVWLSEDYWFGQVDHLSTYPLWFNEETEEIWCQWSDVHKRDFEDDLVFQQMKEIFLGTMTVGYLTPKQEVLRVLPDHIVKNGTLHRYTHSFHIDKSPPPITSWGDILSQSVTDICNNGDTLFLSGGRDSTTIANFAVHNGIDLNYIHISSNDQKLDTQSCKKFEQEMGIKVEYLHPKDVKEYLPEHHDEHWHDGSFRFKYNAMKTLGLKVGITGEFGASEQGHGTINFIHQCTNLTTEKLVNLHITSLESRNDFTATNIFTDKSFEVSDIGNIRRRAYNYIVQYVEELLDYHWQFAKTKEQKIEVLLNIFKQEHESYRLFGYSQDQDHVWYHPLASYDWCNIILNTNPIVRKIGKHERWAYKMATKNYDWFNKTAWEYGPPRGMGSL